MSSVMQNDDDIKAAAREWLLRLSLEQPSADEHAEFARWCGADPRHAAAYRRFEDIWQDAATLKDLAHLAPLSPRPARKGARAGKRFFAQWFAPLPLASAAVAVLLAVFALRSDLVRSWFAPASGRYATATAEIRSVVLADGSTVTLGGRSDLDVRFTPTERRVTLASGEAFFSVRGDATRPFVVAIGDKRVYVVGTEFEVRRSVETLRVSVVQGAVKVAQSPAPRSPERLLVAGQQIVTPLQGAVTAPQKIHAAEPGGWRRGRLAYVDTPLREVIADANRYSERRIDLDDEAIGDLEVSVTYEADQVEQMVDGLARVLPIEILHPGRDRIVLKSVDSRGPPVSTP